MKKLTRNLLVGISAIIALGTLSACSGGSSNQATSSSGAPTTTTAHGTSTTWTGVDSAARTITPARRTRSAWG